MSVAASGRSRRQHRIPAASTVYLTIGNAVYLGSDDPSCQQTNNLLNFRSGVDSGLRTDTDPA